MFDFRDLTEHCIPKGPDFSKAESISISASGNIIRFKAPRHKPSIDLDTETKPIDVNLNDFSTFNFISNVENEKDKKHIKCLGRSWGFKGPVFTGYIAEIFFTLNIYKSLVNKDEGTSLFIENNFEKLILKSLSNRFGDIIDSNDYIQEYLAPVNWSINNILETPSIIHEILPHEDYPHPHKKRLYAVLSNDTYLILQSSMHQKMGGSIKEKDKLIDRQSMIDLTDNIFSSVTIELSEESKKQRDEARSSPDFKPFNSDVKPLKWTTEEQDRMAEEWRKEMAYYKSI